MKKFEYDMSIVIPVYNSEKYISECFESIYNQTYDFDKIQLIFINDGSSDNSGELCLKYKELYPENVVYIEQENSGVSAARNKGIENSKGKYIMFLDSDDVIEKDTVDGIIEVFDTNYEKIDLISYKLKELKNGKLSNKLHYRNKYLNKSGVYDLNEFFYCNITTVNYAIKNQEKLQIKFEGNFQEDQKFATDTVMKKKKIGYTEKGCYIYRRHNTSVTNNSFFAYYLFDSVTKFWEDLFEKYKPVPPYIQSLFINDINWKTHGDLLKPYHYTGKEFDRQWQRILNLINQLDNFVILNHPVLSEEFKYHFIKLKSNKDTKVLFGKKTSNISIINNDELVYSNNYIDLHILRFNVFKDKINIIGYFLNPVFIFCEQLPKLFLIVNNDVKNKILVDIRDSSYSYSRATEKTAKAWLFELELEMNELSKIAFQISVGDSNIDTNFIFENVTPFNRHLIERDKYYKFDKEFSLDKTGKFITIEESTKKQEKAHKKIINNYYFYNDKKRWLFRKIASVFSKTREEIWLYYDCKGVEKDNGYYQFMHDIKMKDGIKRYFVSANDMKKTHKIFKGVKRNKIIKFNSIKHKLYYLKARKVITAYIENNNCCPYTLKSLSNYSDLFIKPEVIYLQHGVLHAHMPWKFSFDRLLVDKEVISTSFEEKNLINNYCFTDQHLIKSGMPRYDFISQDAKPKNKILFAPSWRRYLISNNNGKWVPLEDKFENSSFFKETSEFLNSKKLHKLLEKYDFQLEFKLHPIFGCYKKLYKFNSDRITFSKSTTKNSDYNIFMTDFSSFSFDFVYLKRAIIYFFPDYDLFNAGLNLYRELDLPLENGFGKLVENSSDAIKELEILLKNDCKPKGEFLERTNSLFFYNDNKQRERIYEQIYDSKK